MKIHFDGAAQTVTGSQHLLEINGKQLLLDCGLFQGKRKDFYDRNLKFKYNPASIDAVVLSHAHIDHSGNLPNLVKKGFSGPIYTTPATAMLADVMLRDAGHIQEADVVFVNKKRARQGEPPVEPLYTIEDAARVANYFKATEYDTPTEILPGVTLTLVEAGHIMGSAGIVLDIQENGRSYRLWFSGDIGRPNLPLIKDPVYPSNADYLMMECTYGDKPHSKPEDAFIEFRDVTQRTLNRGGKVIIPAFAVGRTQELVYDLNRMISDGDLPPVPVYVDSPLAVETSKVFQKFPQYYDEETRRFIAEERHPALNFKTLHYVQSVDESKSLNDRHEPMVIISASGMAETGRILHHLRNNIENPRNTILIVSWQAPETLGRRLADREKMVRIFGQWYERRAEVATIGGLSAHAGQDILLQYAAASRSSQKQIYLVHGEPDAASAFEAKLTEQHLGPFLYPAWGEEVEL
jgi:metallo-beta-lactamase family protein